MVKEKPKTEHGVARMKTSAEFVSLSEAAASWTKRDKMTRDLIAHRA